MPSPNTITVDQLSRLIGTPQCPALIDVCIDADFSKEPFLIPTARRHAYTEMDRLAPELQGQKAIVICQKGLKLSQGAAALLRSLGVDAEILDGGMLAWRDAQQPCLPHAAVPWRADGGTLWVTRHRPKIDRIACPWLIRRYIDPKARFLFVAPKSVADVAEKFNATAFDVDGAPFAHVGDGCTFDAMLDGFALRTEPLSVLAKIIRGADTNRLNLAPQSAGLSACLLGLSRMYKDDLQQLDAAMPVMDAFYRWARDAQSEIHNQHERPA